MAEIGEMDAGLDQLETVLRMPGHLLRRCHQIGVAIFHDACSELEITPLQFIALACLAGRGPLDQVSLGGLGGLDRTTVAVVLKNLEERGFVTRRPSQKDRRHNIVQITEAGRAMLKQVIVIAEQVQQRILAPLDREEQAQLTTLLQKIARENNALSRAPRRPV